MAQNIKAAVLSIGDGYISAYSMDVDGKPLATAYFNVAYRWEVVVNPNIGFPNQDTGSVILRAVDTYDAERLVRGMLAAFGWTITAVEND